MALKYRKAAADDKAHIERLFVQMLRSIYHTEDASGYDEGYLDKFFCNGDDWICVAEDDGAVVAYVSIELHRDNEENPFVYIDDISVMSEYQNMGIGTALMETAVQYAVSQGVNMIVLHVEQSNESALRLYERLGFEVESAEQTRFRMCRIIRK